MPMYKLRDSNDMPERQLNPPEHEEELEDNMFESDDDDFIVFQSATE